MAKKSLLFLMFAALISFVVGCGGGGGSKSGNQGTATSLLVAPGTATVLVDGGSQQFTPTVLNESSKAMTGFTATWSASDTTLGTIDSNGKFTAKNKTGTCTVTCTVAGLTKTVNVTVGHIKEAGKQIVDDLNTTYSAAQIITKSQVQDILTNTQNDIVPNIAYVESALSPVVKYGCNIELLALICTSTPGNLSISSEDRSKPGSTLHTGTWEVTFTDTSVWKATYVRSTSGSNDILSVTITSTKDAELSYQITHTYPTAQISNFVNSGKLASYNFNIKGQLVDSNLDASTLNGSIAFSSKDNFVDNFTGKLSGGFNFKFKRSLDGTTNDNYLKFTGDMSVDLQPANQDYISGTLETAELKVSGGLTVNYVANSTFTNGVFPSSIKLDGAIASKVGNEPVTLDGSVAVAVSNGGSVDGHAKWSSSNYLQGSVTFNGSIKADTYNQLVANLKLELLSWRRYQMGLSVNLTTGGVKRTLSLMLKNIEDYTVNAVCKSDWGPAILDVTVHFTSHFDSWSDSAESKLGSLMVNGRETGTVTRSNTGIRVTYSDNTYQELIVAAK